MFLDECWKALLRDCAHPGRKSQLLVRFSAVIRLITASFRRSGRKSNHKASGAAAPKKKPRKHAREDWLALNVSRITAGNRAAKEAGTRGGSRSEPAEPGLPEHRQPDRQDPHGVRSRPEPCAGSPHGKRAPPPPHRARDTPARSHGLCDRTLLMFFGPAGLSKAAPPKRSDTSPKRGGSGAVSLRVSARLEPVCQTPPPPHPKLMPKWSRTGAFGLFCSRDAPGHADGLTAVF
ncbi:hypothetical protein FQA47_006441 [Oryzias melastigma]|uniref:Uncharacterized protein n=1 Tax=Oryzias melastigma TaxID=30732 RepID=A0A834CG28_ORYME|nr:hypothetical protein FQA47_006441 [Oryzias melastigma]